MKRAITALLIAVVLAFAIYGVASSKAVIGGWVAVGLAAVALAIWISGLVISWQNR